MPWGTELLRSTQQTFKQSIHLKKESNMPYFRDQYVDIGTAEPILNPEPIPGYVVNYGTVGEFTYLEMSTGLIYVRAHNCGLKTHAGWVYLHETCIGETFADNHSYTLFELECMALIRLQGIEPRPESKVFQKAYKNLFNKYRVSLLHREYFMYGTKETVDA